MRLTSSWNLLKWSRKVDLPEPMLPSTITVKGRPGDDDVTAGIVV